MWGAVIVTLLLFSSIFRGVHKMFSSHGYSDKIMSFVNTSLTQSIVRVCMSHMKTSFHPFQCEIHDERRMDVRTVWECGHANEGGRRDNHRQIMRDFNNIELAKPRRRFASL